MIPASAPVTGSLCFAQSRMRLEHSAPGYHGPTLGRLLSATR